MPTWRSGMESPSGGSSASMLRMEVSGSEGGRPRITSGKGRALMAREAAALAAVLPGPLRHHPVGEAGAWRAGRETVHRIGVRRGIVIPEYEQVLD